MAAKFSSALEFWAVYLLCIAQVSAQRVLSIPPSGQWDGNDGRWSSFNVTVGNPGQLVRLLPGTSATAGDSIWVVLPEGCTQANPGLDDCPTNRGGVFNRNGSTTWSTTRLANNGLYQLNTYEESKLGLSGNAYYGFDTITLDSSDSSPPTFPDQIIAGIATNNFWLGSLGLSPLPLNFTSQNEQTPSLLGTLRNSNNTIIPSTTWSYTAGASYRDTLGSLTLGGYNASRFSSDQAISIPFYADQSRDLQVHLRSIMYDTLGSVPLLTEGVYMFIDSMVSQIWLPEAACEAFEEAFGLELDNTTQLYLLNETTHARLRAQNPTFNFTIAASENLDGESITISFPYAAFDLNVSAPYVNGSMPYFPIRKAENSAQYVLGRTFLQEAYVIADYDRGNFTVGQTLGSGGGERQELVTIHAPNVTGQTGASESETVRGAKLSGGTIAGIVVGSVVLVAVCVGLAVWILRRRRRFGESKVKEDETPHTTVLDTSDQMPPKPEEVQGVQIQEKSAEEVVELNAVIMSELPVAEKKTELPSGNEYTELPADHGRLHELEGN